MGFIKFLGRFFWKLISIIPAFIIYRYRVFHENKKNKGIPSHKARIIIVNECKGAKHTLFYTNYFKHVHVLHKEKDGTYKVGSKVLKRGQYVFYLLKNEGICDYLMFLALKNECEVVPAYIGESKHWYERKKIIYGEPIDLTKLVPNANSSEAVKAAEDFICKKITYLKHKLSLYLKYKTQDTFSFKFFVFDFFRGLYKLTKWFVFPSKKHYVDTNRKEARKIKGRGIIAAKHRTFFDPIILYPDYNSRRIRIVIADQLFEKFKWIVKHANAIIYHREKSTFDPKMMLETLNTLKAEGVVAIFPEGHLYADEFGEFSDGAAFFALQTNTPIYPYVMVKPWKPFRFNHIMIGKPLYPDKIFTEEERKNGDCIHKLTLILKDEMIRLNEEGQKYLKK